MRQRHYLTALLVLTGLVVPADAATKLEWKFQKGKTFYQKITTETNQTMTISGQKISQKQSQTFYFSWTPLKYDKDKKTWKIRQKIEAVKLEIEIGGQKIPYDSTKEQGQNNPLAEFFRQLVDSEFTFTVNKSMKIVGTIGGKEKFMEKLVKVNSQMEPLLKQILNDEAFKQMADPTFSALPGDETDTGKTWKRTSNLNMGPIGKYKIVYTYKYVGKDKKKKDLDRITVKAKMEYKAPDSTKGPQLPFKIEKAKLDTTDSSGYILYDAKKGRIVKSEMELKVAGKLDINIGNMVTKVDLTQTQETTVETSDKPQVTSKKKKKKKKAKDDDE
jgi:hypothetical protein